MGLKGNQLTSDADLSKFFTGKHSRSDKRKIFLDLSRRAQRDDLLAKFGRAYCLFHGIGVTADARAAMREFSKIFREGYANAAFCLGVGFQFGLGVLRSPAKARRWYKIAAEKNIETAQFNYGFCLDTGFGGKTDPAEAAKWYRRAAQRGDESAPLNLANLYFNGRGVRRSLRIAKHWYAIAAERGDKLGKRYLEEQTGERV